MVHETIRRMINRQVLDLVGTSARRIESLGPLDVEAVRSTPTRLVAFSEEGHGRHLELKRFLREHLYRHYRVHRMARKAMAVVRELYGAFTQDPRCLPTDAWRHVSALEGKHGDRGRARGVADYIAGMTDRFAIAEHERIYHPSRLT